MSKKTTRHQPSKSDAATGRTSPNAPTARTSQNSSVVANPARPKRVKHLRLIILIAIFIPLAYFGGRQINANWQSEKIKNLIRRFDDNVALEQIRQAENKNGKTGELEFLRSRAYRHLANYERSQQHLELARQLKFKPDVLRREQMLLDAQQGYIEEAEKNLDQLIEQSGSDFGEVCLALTYGYLVRMRFQEALGMIGLWKRQEPKSPQPPYLTGLMAQYQRQWETADKLFDESLKFQDDFLPTILAKAQNKLKLSQFAEAVPYFKSYVERIPDNADAQRGLAEALFGSGSPADSQLILKELIANGNRSFETRLLLGKSQLETGDAKAAIETLVPLSQSWPDDVDLNYTLSRAYSQIGQEDRANVHLAAMEAGRKKIEDIDLRLREAEVAQDNPMLRYEMGHLLMHYSSREEGRIWLQSALMQNPNIIAAHQDLEQYFTRVGNSAMAMYHRSFIKKLGGQVPLPPTAPPNPNPATPASPS
jgi:tetratricopeptide (TPR) repeat protein